MKKQIHLVYAILFLVTGISSGQRVSESSLFNRDFPKMNKIELFQNGNLLFENTRLYKVSPDSIFVAVSHFNGQYFTNKHSVVKFNMDDIDEVLLRHRKKGNLYSIIGGLVIGTASYFVAKEVFYRPKDRLSLTMQGLAGQEYQSAVWEPYVAATLGFGVGVMIGTSLSEFKAYPASDSKYAYWKMKTMSFKKRGK